MVNLQPHKIGILFLILLGIILPNLAFSEDYQLVGIRIDFNLDEDLATPGNGKFVSTLPDVEICSDFIYDEPPHDKSYFQSHFQAAKNYWEKVSNNQLTISKMDVFPAGIHQVYSTDTTMLSFHPFLEDYDETELLFKLAKQAILLSDDDVDYTQYNTVIVFHAGLGGDFDFVLDPTPGSIPSAYLNHDDLNAYGGIHVDNIDIESVIILPESQNFLQFEETKDLFADATDPCFYQFGLNGSMALMLGFHFGLDPMFDTSSGKSLLGKFVLMDQGSNNFHGIAPAYPNPYTRIKRGWITPQNIGIGDEVSLAINSDVAKLNINEHEYYLIENHLRNFIDPSQMIEIIDTLLQDTISVLIDVNGVILDVDENSGGMPGNGLLIWHINENARYTDENPNGGGVQLVDVVEADGAQDIGFESQLLFADFLTTGWWFDYWFGGNKGWFDLNKRYPIIGDSLLTFNNATNPSTKTSEGLPTYLGIENISRVSSVMTFNVTSTRKINTDSLYKIAGIFKNIDKEFIVELDENMHQLNMYLIDAFNIPLLQSSLTIPTVLDNDTLFMKDEFLFFQNNQILRIYNLKTLEFNAFEGTIISEPALMDSIFYFAKTLNNNTTSYTIDQSTLHAIDSTLMTSDNLKLMPYYKADGGTSLAYLMESELHIGSSVISSIHSAKNINMEIGNAHFSKFMALTTGDDLLLLDALGNIELTLENVENYLPLPISQSRLGFITWKNDEIKAFDWDGHSLSNFPVHIDDMIDDVLISINNHTNEANIIVLFVDAYIVIDINGKIVDKAYTGFNADVFGKYLFLSDGSSLMSFPFLDNSDYLWETPKQVSAHYVLANETFSADLLDKSKTYNYPNPVDGSFTTIRSWVGDASAMSIEFYSLTGHLVDKVSLSDLNRNAVNEWDWNVSDIQNGVYYANIRVKASNREENKIIKIAITH